MNIKGLKKVLTASAAAAVIGLAAAPASASLVFTFNNNLGGGPFGTVTVTQVGQASNGVVSVAVALSSGVGFVSTGLENFAFNLSPSIPSLSAANFTNFTSGWSFGGAAGNTDGAGAMQYALDCSVCGNGGNNPNPGPMGFTLTAAGLLESSFIGNAATGAVFGADICTSFSAGNGCSGATGFTWTLTGTSTSTSSTSSGPPASSGVPEPSSTSLALLGLLVLAGTFVKRRFSRQAPAHA